MTIEAAVAIGSGVAAGSLTLTAFGIDSLIELVSATVLVWRLTVELRHGQAFAENTERTASRIGAALLFALAAYVIELPRFPCWCRVAMLGVALLNSGNLCEQSGFSPAH
jgi:hypothetical protein